MPYYSSDSRPSLHISCSFTEIDSNLLSVVLIKDVAQESKTAKADLINLSLVQDEALVKDDALSASDETVSFSSFSSSKWGLIL